jgi:acetamidase/formamidase
MPSEKIDIRYVNPQTGPFYVEGAEPGDTLVLHIVDLEPARSSRRLLHHPVLWWPVGHRSHSHVAHPLPEATWIYEVDKKTNTVGFSSRFGDLEFAMPIENMLGTVGVAHRLGKCAPAWFPNVSGATWTAPKSKWAPPSIWA